MAVRYSRRNRSNGASYILTTESTHKYTQAKVQQWLYEALEHGAEIDSSFFDCLAYAQNGLHVLVHMIDGLLSNAAPQYVQNDLRMLSKGKKRELREELKSTHPKRHASFLEDVWSDYPEFQGVFKEIIQAALDAEKNIPIPHEIKVIRKNVNAYLGCSASMLDFLEFVHAIRNIPQVEQYFENIISIEEKSKFPLLAKILGIPLADLREVISEAFKCGFLDGEIGHCFHMTSLMDKLWATDKVSKLEDLLYVQLKVKALPLENYHIPPDTISHVSKLLASTTDEPMHILLYGAAGTGKTSFAQSLASELGVKAWAVASGADDGDKERRAALIACTHIASKHKGAFVLVDEAERLLDTDFTGFSRTKDKAWLNSFLEQKGRRIIWITNHIEHIDQAVRRRFAYSIHFEALTETQRQYAWLQIIKDAKVTSRLTQDEVKALVRNYPVPVAVVSKAIKQAKLMQERKGNFAKTIERILDAHVTLERDGHKQKKIAVDTNSYTLDGVTLEQGREHNIANIMQKVHKIDNILKQGELPKGRGSMLFYGPPGTGKSALAKYMAQELGRECVIKKASDLLSKYVGESEQNIAHAFNEAEKNGDILVIDEADSFIYSRESASRSWEVTQVNEFLTQLEEYKGICVCTSNRRTSMDMAAMRRFSFKIPFTYAGKEQLERLYMSILAPLCKQALTAAELSSLLACKQLTPGDFAAVRSQFWLDDDINHATLIQALMREQKDKLDNAGKMLGFK